MAVRERAVDTVSPSLVLVRIMSVTGPYLGGAASRLGLLLNIVMGKIDLIHTEIEA